jgi:hypothetical protein
MINRTIDNPIDKFDKLVSFIDENDMWDSIYLKENLQGNISIKPIWVKESQILEVLGVSKRTLDNWVKKYDLKFIKNVSQHNYMIPKGYEFVEKKAGIINNVKNYPRYYLLHFIFDLLSKEARKSQKLKNNI